MFRMPTAFFDKPADQGGGTPPADTKPADAPGGSDSNESNAAPKGGASGAPEKPYLAFASEAEFQSRVDELLKDRLERKEKQTRERENKARQEAEAKALVEQGDFKALSERQAKRIAELETAAADLATAQAQLGKYETALKASLAAQLAGVPEHIQDLLKRMDVTEQMEWISANQDKLKPAQPAAAPDISATKRSTSPQTKMTDEERREFAARYGVRPEFLPS